MGARIFDSLEEHLKSTSEFWRALRDEYSGPVNSYRAKGARNSGLQFVQRGMQQPAEVVVHLALRR